MQRGGKLSLFDTEGENLLTDDGEDNNLFSILSFVRQWQENERNPGLSLIDSVLLHSSLENLGTLHLEALRIHQ